jgi:type II secretory pathway component GspD/PulD (secretin)
VAFATQIITTLDATPAQERKAQVYRRKNARSQTVETSLRTFLQQDLQRITSILGPTGIGTAQNILDREVSIVSETNSNSLPISASPRYFDEVRQLVEELDQPQPQVLI